MKSSRSAKKIFYNFSCLSITPLHGKQTTRKKKFVFWHARPKIRTKNYKLINKYIINKNKVKFRISWKSSYILQFYFAILDRPFRIFEVWLLILSQWSKKRQNIEFHATQIDASDWAGMNRIKSDYYFTDLHRMRFKTFSDWFGMILNLNSDSFRLIRIKKLCSDSFKLMPRIEPEWIGLRQMFILLICIQWDSKRFRIGLEWIWIRPRIHSDWFELKI